MAALHVALSAREDLSDELRAAHVCAALSIAANGRSTHADGWHFDVDRDALGAVEREVAETLAIRYAHDPRAAAACGSISGYSDMMIMCCVFVALALVAAVLTMVKPHHQGTRKKKSTRAEALVALATLPEPPLEQQESRTVVFDRRMRRSVRYRRPMRACTCDSGGGCGRG